MTFCEKFAENNTETLGEESLHQSGIATFVFFSLAL